MSEENARGLTSPPALHPKTFTVYHSGEDQSTYYNVTGSTIDGPFLRLTKAGLTVLVNIDDVKTVVIEDE